MIDQLQFDLYCGDHATKPGYRVYINDDLLTERTYLWNNAEEFVQEHCELRLPAGTHRLKIQSVNGAGEFIAKNVVLNGVVIPGSGAEIVFDKPV